MDAKPPTDALPPASPDVQADETAPSAEIEPLSISTMARFFGVPLIIVSIIVGGAVMVVLMFGSLTSTRDRDIQSLLLAIEGSYGERSAGMLLPTQKELWQAAQELSLRLDNRDEELTEEELDEVARRLAILVTRDFELLERQARAGLSEPRGPGKNVDRLDYLMPALAATRHPAAVEPLLKILQSDLPDRRIAVMWKLADLHELEESRRAIEPILEVMADSADRDELLVATTALSRLARPGDRHVIDALATVRIHGGDVDWSASLALARLGSDKGRITLMDLLDRKFWEEEARYEKLDKKSGVVQRYPMPPERIEEFLKVAIDAAANLDDSDLWEMIERLKSDASYEVQDRAAAAIRGRAGKS